MSRSPHEDKSGTPHSSEWFSSVRDHWWNSDFLELMARRLRLGQVTALADIGCGVGHWSRLLFPFVAPHASLLGLDREAAWLPIARRQFHKKFPGRPAVYVQADASSLPLRDNSCDAVTCQTLLIHVADPRACLREMIRVAKPGGLVLCVEPNNLFNMLERGSNPASVEEQVADYEFWSRWRTGKVSLGEGDHGLGDLLPGLFAEAGLSDVRVHLNDQVSALFPPYEHPAQIAALEEENAPPRHGAENWGIDALKRYYVAGGGTAESFALHITRLARRSKGRRAAIARGEYHEAGGGLFYVVSGRKGSA